MPLLDIVEEFARANSTPYEWECDENLVTQLRAGNCEFVFGIDESGDMLLRRLYPELSGSQRSVEATARDLKRFSPKSKECVLRFLALRKSATMELFGEEMLTAIRKLTGWKWQRVSQFRRDFRNNQASDLDVQEFLKQAGADALEYFQKWDSLCFHRSHLIGWWQHLATSMTCKIRDEKTWRECVQKWERENRLAWNDIGVVLDEAKLLTPL